MKLSAILLAVLALAVTPFASAHVDREVILGGASVHVNAPASTDYDDFSPAVGVHAHGWQVIVFENSFDDLGVFLGYHHEVPLLVSPPNMFKIVGGLRTGVATGYKTANSDFTAVVHPTVTFYSSGMGLELGVLPTGALDPANKGSDAVITAAIRVKI